MTLSQAFFANEGKGSDKWEHYFPVYDRELHRFIAANKPIELLEIGVQNGGSLEIWGHVLPEGSGITGIDIDPKVSQLTFQRQGTRAFVGDASDPATLERLFDGWHFDVVIDDGSHRSKDVISTFRSLWARLTPGGVYIVEDLHTSYATEYGGGYKNPMSSVEAFKDIADLVNADHVADFEALRDPFFVDLAATVASVTFYDSMVVIERAVARKLGPFRRVQSGQRFDVADSPGRMATQPRAVLDTLQLAPGFHRELSTALISRVAEAASTHEADQIRLAEAETLGRRLIANADAASARSRLEQAQVLADVETDLNAEKNRADAAAARAALAEDRCAQLEKRLSRLGAHEADLMARLDAERAERKHLQDRLDPRADEMRDSLRAIDAIDVASNDPIASRVQRLVDSRRTTVEALPELVAILRLYRFRGAVLEATIEGLMLDRKRLTDTTTSLLSAFEAAAQSWLSKPLRWSAAWRGRADPFAAARSAHHALEEVRRQSDFPSALLRRSIPDLGYYAAMNPDLVDAQVDLAEHFFTSGAAEGRPAHPEFDAEAYADANPDVVDAGLAPMLHYLSTGAVEGREPLPGGSAEQRLSAAIIRLSGMLKPSPGVQFEPGIDEAMALVRAGGGESASIDPREGVDRVLDDVLAYAASLRSGDRPKPLKGLGRTSRDDAKLIVNSGLFEADWYALTFSDVSTDEGGALKHFLAHGRAEGRAPNRVFDPAWYAAQDEDVGGPAAAFVHYLRHGNAEGRRPSATFDPVWYASQHAKDGVSSDTALSFYLETGRARGDETDRAGAWSAAGSNGLTPRKILRAFGQQWAPLPVHRDHRAERTVTVLTDSVDAHSLFGGVGTSLLFGVLMAKRLGARLRLVTRTNAPEAAALGEVLLAHGVEWDGPSEFLHVPVEGGNTMALGPDDVVVTTSWWTTSAALGGVPANQIVYLLQEDERMFYPFGDMRLRCEEVMARPDLRVVINTEILRDHLTGPGGVPGLEERSLSFEPAFPAASAKPDPWRPDGRKTLFFYARPHHLRNLYLRGLEALDRAVAEGVFDAASWNFVFAGADLPAMTIGDIVPTMIAKVPWTDYAALTARVDLGLCLMDTPHPSYPPIDLAASGAVVVTNRHGNKTSLDRWSRNIIASDSAVDALVDALRQGAALAGDENARRANYESQEIPRDWNGQFDHALRMLFPTKG